MRTKRFLLVTAALSTAVTGAAACGKNPATPDAGETLPLPANPKGSFYDAGIEPTPDPQTPTPDGEAPKDAGTIKPPPLQDAGKPIINRLPANPKGSHYDAGRPKKPTDPSF